MADLRAFRRATILIFLGASLLRAQSVPAPEYDNAARAYLDHLSVADAAALDSLFTDLSVIATGRERAEWKGLNGPDAKRTALRRFWLTRAVRAGLSEKARIAEHLRRLEYAVAHFGLPTGRVMTMPPLSAIKIDRWFRTKHRFDDRGLVYVLHGPPVDIVRTVTAITRPNETWAYPNTDGTYHTFTFVRGDQSAGFYLVPDLFSIFETPDPASLRVGSWRPLLAITGADGLAVFQDRAQYIQGAYLIGTRLHQLRSVAAGGNPAQKEEKLRSLAGDVRMQQGTIEMLNRAQTYTALSWDSYTHPFTKPLDFRYQVLAFRNTDRSCTDVVFGVALPGESVVDNAGRPAGFSLSLLLADTTTGFSTVVDTTYRIPVNYRSNTLVVSRSQCVQPTSTLLHSVILRNLAQPQLGGGKYGVDTVPNFNATALSISSVILAADQDGAYKRGGFAFALVPQRQFRVGEPIRMYYELYGAQADNSYRIEIVLRRPNEKKALFTVAFNEPTNAAGQLNVHRLIRPELKAGSYDLILRVTESATRRTVERRAFLTLVNSAR